MSTTDIKESKEFWDRVASDWDIQVGDEGDRNRMLNSDPILWDFAGDVTGLDVLDAGCGTGYLAKKLSERGAKVIGIDVSENMIAIAREKIPDLDFRVDSCSQLTSVNDESVDMVIANYVLMDTPELENTVASFYRVLKSPGSAILIFSHPCFPGGKAQTKYDSGDVSYHWNFSYFERTRCTDPPWKHFKSEFIWYHRPLSDYWKAFKNSGFDVVEFEEPRINPSQRHLAESDREFFKFSSRPYSVAFKLVKTN